MAIPAIKYEPEIATHSADRIRDYDIITLIDKITLAPDKHVLAEILFNLDAENIKAPTRVAFVNAHGFNLSCRDKNFLGTLIDSEYVFRDGAGMKILFKMLGRDPGLNLNGTDLIPKIIEIYKGQKLSLLGTSRPYLERSGKIIRKKGLEPVLLLDGFQDDKAYLEAARKNRAPLIILAMGMPKQERVADLLASHLDYPCLIICGGAILDFLGGKVTRAPVIFRRLGMEWLYRLAQEPRRLFRRYVIGNFVFLFRSFFLALRFGRIGENGSKNY